MTEKDEIAALKEEIEEFRSDQLRYMQTVLDMKSEIASLRRDIEYKGERIAALSTAHARVLCEHRERLAVLESHSFKDGKGLDELHKIIGPPNPETRPDLDKFDFDKLFSPKGKPAGRE